MLACRRPIAPPAPLARATSTDARVVDIFDTTLRDGSQQEGLSLTVDDKLRVAEQLDHLGVAYIEGGWPGANPKDEEFFARAPVELRLATATLVAFGSTRGPGCGPRATGAANLVKAGTEVVCLVAKASETHVTDALRTSLDEALAMAGDSVASLGERPTGVLRRRAFLRRLRAEPGVLEAVLAAAKGRGETLVLCDTNGGTLPHEVEEIVSMVGEFGSQIGVHFHNDSGCAVANSLAAVRVGATQVQGCVNGYGERAGNADLSAVIPNLSLKLLGAHDPAGTPRAAHACGPPHRRAGQRVAQPAAAVRRGRGLRAQSRSAHERIAGAADAYEHVAPDTSATGRVSWCRSSRAGPLWPSRPRSWPRAGFGGWDEVLGEAQVARAPRATTSRWPTDPSSCCCVARRVGSRITSRSSPTG